MNLFLDSADPKEIEKWKDHVDGVTTNPILLKRSELTPKQFYDGNRNNFNNIFIQVHKEEDLLFHDKGVIYKIPLTLDNIILFKFIKDTRQSRTCATTVYDPFQFNLACQLGCDFSIVLCHKNKDKSFLRKCVRIKKEYNYSTKIIAASFRSKEEVEVAILTGADYATVPPKVLEECFENECTVRDCKEYAEYL